MNKRIKELTEQAASTIDTTRGNTYVSHPEFNKKFAELIVRECLAMCKRAKDDCEWRGKEFNIDQMQQQIGVNLCMAEIKKHFGVENDR